MRRTMKTTVALFAGLLQPLSGAAATLQEAGGPGELTQRQAAVQVLNRLGYGPRPGDVERVMRMGIAAYVEAQLYPESIRENPELERRLAEYTTLAMSSTELFLEYPTAQRARAQMQRQGGALDTAALRMAARRSFVPVQELSQARLARALYSERQLEEVMVDFWLNHFNVYSRKGAVRLFLTEYERDVIRRHALGNFRDLLGSVARSPAMLFYLDNWLSAAPEGAPRAGEPPNRGRRRAGDNGVPGQRRAAGLNENYARELMELHTLGVGGGYTQDDVEAVARAFTGWTIDLRTGSFLFRPDLHDATTQEVLGQEIDSRGISEGEQILDLLARHPSTARFISEKLVRRFVSDDPPEALVERAASTFRASDGDVREVVRLIVTSPEFFSRDAYRAKVKTPLEWLASSARGLDIEVRDLRPLLGALRQLDQPLYGAEPPTGYPDVAEAWASSGALLTRAEMSQRLARAGMRGPTGHRLLSGSDPVEDVLERLLPGVETDRLGTLIESAAEGQDAPRKQLETAVSLTLSSPEFQRR